MKFGKLSKLQSDVLQMVKAQPGIKTKEIAIALGASAQTIEVSVYRIRKKGFDLRYGLVAE